MSPTVMKKLAKPMLFASAFIWGSAFVIMKNALDNLPVLYLLAIRFTVGAVLMCLACGRKWRLFAWDYLWRGALAGVLLFLGFYIQTLGLALTTPSKNAFLTSIYCVIVPFLYWAVMGVRPDRFNLLAAVFCVAGVGLVSLNGDLSVNPGDLLTLCCSLFFAAHIVAVARVSEGKDIYLLTAFQFVFSALCGWFGVLVSGTAFPATALARSEVLFAMAYLGVMATTVALLFQTVGQINSDAASASVILSLESVFGVLCSVLFYGDRVTPLMFVGFCLIFVAVVCSETKFSFLRRRKKAPEEGTPSTGGAPC